MTADMRLLPWTGAEGKPCYLVGDGTGPVSRLADTVESVQLDMADGLLGHAADLLAESRATPAQLRFLLARMREALTDVHRIAESRGARLPVPVPVPIPVPACEDSDLGDQKCVATPNTRRS